MKKQINQVIEWHKAFGVPYSTIPIRQQNFGMVTLRVDIMEEEIREWQLDAAAYTQTNAKIPLRAKELADILYTVIGTIITEGLQNEIERVFDLVHESNMSKLDDDGKPIMRSDGKILKGPNYKAPDLSFLLFKKSK